MKTIKYRSDYQPLPIEVESVHLTFELGEVVIVENRMRMVVSELKPLFMDGDAKLVSFKAIGAEASIDQNQQGFWFTPTQSEVEIEITTELEPHKNTSLMGLYASRGSFCTQCEAEGFRKITFFFDRPDIMSNFTTTIRADKEQFPHLLSNGDVVESRELPGNRHEVIWRDPFRKPCYLFALVAGKFDVLEDHFITKSGKKVQLKLYAEPGQGQKCSFAMESLKQSMAWDEQRFDLEYDLSTYMIVAVGDFNFGAMENKGLNIFNTKYVLADPNISTDDDFIAVEAVIGHEYFHNWTGNRVTCRDWFQLSLKEGLTVFRDQEFTADLHSRPVKRIQDVRIIRSAQFAEDASPMAHPIRPDSYVEMNNFYTVTVYNKGAEVIRMIHTLLGEENFQNGMRLYFKRHDGQAVTCEDFVCAMEDASGVDLKLFRLWYSQDGTPQVEINQMFDAKNQKFRLTFKQYPAHRQQSHFHIPVKVGFLDKDGRSMALSLNGEKRDEWLLSLTEPEQSFSFDAVEQPIASLFRDFSAPVKAIDHQSAEEKAVLMGHDANLFQRWDAAQWLFNRTIRAEIESLPDFLPLRLALATALKNCIADAQRDPALMAEVLVIPPLRLLAEEYQPTIPLDQLHRAHSKLKKYLSETLLDDLKAAYMATPRNQPGERKLRNALLSLMVASNQDPIWELAEEQIRTSQNMTELLTPTALFANSSREERQGVLDSFAKKFESEPLAMDKWFACQALADQEFTLNEVKSLTLHPKMDMRNPNKVYALLGSFGQNLARFHAADGSGYTFMADQIMALDGVNSHLSSRLVRALMNWRRFDGSRGGLMQEQLQRIQRLPKLSDDVAEIIHKSLAQNDPGETN